MSLERSTPARAPPMYPFPPCAQHAPKLHTVLTYPCLPDLSSPSGGCTAVARSQGHRQQGFSTSYPLPLTTDQGNIMLGAGSDRGCAGFRRVKRGACMRETGLGKSMKTGDEAGFTLVELMIAMMIMSILAVATAPQLIGLLRSYRLNGAAGLVWTDLYRARMLAIKERRSVQVDFTSTAYNIVRV